ncbi:hypothetical protein OCK74_08225 [Chitinophagaceae bacterium LB-8]|uniref:Tetratricopeptide repeat protein n=1 Tax=Paraflavisolibacter caeni TaxID=2982496 RepID=A0A9X3BHS6_9BACT|nr:hypothetical protein [Paraflavisolibacter caeni]MCU7549098.1 hypothetical protein [Paraflavisolibacter caeni]
MSDRFNLISQQILQKDLSNCSLEELQQLSEQYPFFAPAQFLLARKLKENNSPAYAQQFQKAALYHHNSLELDFLINDQDYDSIFPSALVSSPAESSILTPADTPETTLPEIPDLSHLETPVSTPDETSESEVSFPGPQPVDQPVELPEEQNIAQPVASKETSITVSDQPSDNSLSFEPYYTVDYFASVGIKLSQEEVSKDSFGRQLKSFTEWLKTMKRLPAVEQLKKLDPHAEEKVENIAAHSLDNSEILTETMAEVWVKQGKLEKAIEVYNKLCLLNPSKRAYFATKLENLKKAL